MNSRCKSALPTSEGNNLKVEEKLSDTVFEKLLDAIKSIRYGTVQIHIQDGKIIQIDKIDKMRLR